jgi:hypothetical protein
MKKFLLFLATASLMAACTPTTPTTTTGSDTTKVDSVPVVVQDSQPAVDSVTPAVADGGTTTDAGPAADPNGKPASTDASTGTGRQANPNGNLGAKHFTVSGRFLVKSPYCGGAAPTPDMVTASQTPQPFAGQGFIIRKGTTNGVGSAIETRVTTDNNGAFSVSLTAGTYCMVLNEKENRRTPEFLKTAYYEIDKKCDDKWLGTCELSFTVADKNVSGLRVTLERKCQIASLSPCIQWGGPLPPAAAPRGK